MNTSPMRSRPQMTASQVLSPTSRSSTNRNLSSTPSRVDNHNTLLPPLDLSFQSIDTVAGIETAISAKEYPHSTITGLKLGYNGLSTIAGLAELLESLLPGTSESLVLLDLSYNKLSHVEDELLKFPNLTFLSLSGNAIQSVLEVRKLNVLPLTKFCFQGNQWEDEPPTAAGAVVHPAGRRATNGKLVTTESGALAYVTKQLVRVESTKNYRTKLLWYLRDTRLKTLDNVVVAPKEKEIALDWGHSLQRIRAQRERNV